MNQLSIHLDHALEFIDSKKLEKYDKQTRDIIHHLEENSDDPSSFLGWLNLPSKVEESTIQEINQAARSLSNNLDTVVVTGIGGSYLGAKAVIDALSPFFHSGENKPEIIFAGYNIDEDYHYELREHLEERNYGIVVISKSGTTTEPGIAFRILKNHLENKVGKDETSRRIIAITDAQKGALRKLANEEGYQTFVIPDNIGGRYSVLTPVGLVPIAIAGYDIRGLIEGAEEMRKRTLSSVSFNENPSSLYAAVRNELYQNGKAIELLGIYNLKLFYFMEWWKQLYGESEGKDHKGIFPAIAQFTTDLHSIGQYIQEGRRILFETILSIQNPKHQLTVPKSEDDTDNLNYLAGKRLHEVNTMAESGTRLAHTDGDVPNIRITIPEIKENFLGQIIYFFEKACAISGNILEVNPFDQPGVEAYKKNMFALLGKSGYESESQKLLNRIKKQ
ncbi:MAG: glucose-6-phosphate isomerase [Bacteroidales bacterium]|nr:glucose-6-phosphate isomerase [Bacteroidales bacterium]